MLLQLSLVLLACASTTSGTPQQVDDDADGYSVALGDCDDNNALVHPLADEWCDGIDNDCDHEIDEDSALDALTWNVDADGDGFGDADQTVLGCSLPVGAVDDSTDCNDDDATIFPGAEEIPCDGIAQSCTDVDGDRAVPEQYAQLQDAISDAIPGETICVAEGSYGPIVVDRALTIIAKQGANRTEIVGDGGPVVTVNAVDGLVLTGFMLTGGDALSGGGMLIQNSSNVWVSDCVFTQNSAQQGGAVAFLSSQDSRIDDSAFTWNSATSGGAITVWGGSDITIAGATFDGNAADDGGGAISAVNTTDLAVSDSTLNNNGATQGGGLYGARSTLTLDALVVSNNQAELGGGLYLEDCDLVATDGEISDNLATGDSTTGKKKGKKSGKKSGKKTGDSTAGAGGGLWASGGSVSFTDTVFSGNQPEDQSCTDTSGC